MQRSTIPQNSAESLASTASGQPEERLLEQVLLETAAPDEMQPDDWQALVEVARRHTGRPFERDPVLLEMVDSLLRLRGGAFAAQGAHRRSMLEQICTTLSDDEPTRERLALLWQRLCEAAQ